MALQTSYTILVDVRDKKFQEIHESWQVLNGYCNEWRNNQIMEAKPIGTNMTTDFDPSLKAIFDTVCPKIRLV